MEFPERASFPRSRTLGLKARNGKVAALLAEELLTPAAEGAALVRQHRRHNRLILVPRVDRAAELQVAEQETFLAIIKRFGIEEGHRRPGGC